MCVCVCVCVCGVRARACACARVCVRARVSCHHVLSEGILQSFSISAKTMCGEDRVGPDIEEDRGSQYFDALRNNASVLRLQYTP